MSSSCCSLLFFLTLLFLQPLFSQANLHKSNTLLKSSLLSQPSTNETIPPTLFFEVTKPIRVPNAKPCSLTILQHDFGYTYGKPPVVTNYAFPSDCPHQEFSKIVLEWNATCKGRQFDRIFGVWLSGVELLRSCTAEPRATGIVWSVQKDITRYTSLLLMNKTQTFSTYTGVYHVNITLYFYPFVEKMNRFEEKAEILGSGVGGINPLLWRPISGVGSFDLPTYDIEITPFLGNLLDEKTHKLGFSVTNALNVWYIDANLHLWLDSKSTKTEGKLLQHDIVPLGVSSVSDFKGLNGTFITNTTRFISSTGWVKSSYGTVTTKSIQDLSYSNSMVMAKDGDLQIVHQMIHFNDSIYAKMPDSDAKSKKSLKRFLLYLYSDYLDQGNGTSMSVANVTLGFNEKKYIDADARLPSSSLRNLQNGQGVMVVKDNLVVSGVGSTQQTYNYDSSKFCYSRNISSSNYTILYDEVGKTCNNRAKFHFGFALSRWWPFPARRAFLASHVVDPNGN
ncbi:Peptide-N4-(N-acetyl-beta-glucosaminyl)asparagine amidase A - like 3 [Theobroma cacao]|nr:Peptide-N4-(N-acetyl-beta-glucosaminyl)asparagine amidase A - like 3 [Theobroma cacao]